MNPWEFHNFFRKKRGSIETTQWIKWNLDKVWNLEFDSPEPLFKKKKRPKPQEQQKHSSSLPWHGCGGDVLLHPGPLPPVAVGGYGPIPSERLEDGPCTLSRQHSRAGPIGAAQVSQSQGPKHGRTVITTHLQWGHMGVEAMPFPLPLIIFSSQES